LDTQALIALPVYNEALRLTSVLAQLIPYRERTIFVNDGSTDASRDLICSAGFELIDFPTNMGLSAVYRAVFSYASKLGLEKIVFLDSDGQHKIKHIPDFELHLGNNKLVCGSRFANPDTVPPAKIASNLFAVLLIREITGVLLPDVACGFRALKKGLDWPVISNSFGFEVIYSILINSCLKNESPVFVKIDPIYDNQSVFYTRKLEVGALLNAIDQHNHNELANLIKTQFESGMDLSVSLSGFDFCAKRYNGNYVFETDDHRAREFFKKINNEL
jgi:glycosyltransferase involved in cell wall biosynthesis